MQQILVEAIGQALDASLTEFGAHLEPALRVEQDKRFLVETQDNFFGEIKNRGGPADAGAVAVS